MLYPKYCYDHHIKEDERGEACSAHGETRNAYKILHGKPEGNRPLGGHRRRWEDNITRSSGKN
jgi:hypothetical protein